jgi:hypothetical protein
MGWTSTGEAQNSESFKILLTLRREYPGAPDRGGKKEDTDNFVLLMETLRRTFDAEARDLGLTFTAPSSFWYLRWFDLPGLMKYADWVNVVCSWSSLSFLTPTDRG